MKYAKNAARLTICLLIAVSLMHIGGNEAFAGSEAGHWRPTYDLIMKWVNFGILIFIAVKYARPPVMNFLRGQGDKFARTIDQLEEEKENLITRIKDMFKELDESDLRLAALKQRIIEQGEKRKQEIIQDAMEQTRYMMQNSKQQVMGKIIRAKLQIRDEMVELAIGLATEKLPKILTKEDDTKWIGHYIASA